MSTKTLLKDHAGTQQVVQPVDSFLVEKLWHELDGQVSREQISDIVQEIAVRYKDATVQAFVPIFIHRQALEHFNQGQTPTAVPPAPNLG